MRVARLAGFGAVGLMGLSLASLPVPVFAQEDGGAKPALSASKKWEAEFSRWQKVSSGKDVAAYEAYLKDYPDGTFASMARIRIAELKAAAAKAGATSETATSESKTDEAETAGTPAGENAETDDAGKKRSGKGLDVAVSPEAEKADADKAAKAAAAKAKADAEEKARQQAEAERRQAEEQAAAEKTKQEAEAAARAEAAKAEEERLAAEVAAREEEERAAAEEARAREEAAEAERQRAEEAAEAERRQAEEAAEAERLKAEEAAEAERDRQAQEAAAAEERARDARSAEAEAARLKAEAVAESKREADAFEAAVLDGSVAAFQAYIDSFPKGRFVGEAKQRIAAIEEGGDPQDEAQGSGEDVAAIEREERPAVEEPEIETPVIDQREAYLRPRQRANAQRWLTALGFRTYGIDGVFGPRTRRAIAAWQQSNGYQADGYLTRKQFRALNQAGRFAARRHNDTVVRRQPRYDDGYGYYYEGPVEDYYGGYYYDGDVIISGPGY